MNREEQKKLKKAGFVDATPIFKYALRLGRSGTPEKKEAFDEALRSSFDKGGMEELNKAIANGVLTQEEWQRWTVEYGFEYADMQPVLSIVNGKLNSDPEHPAVILTAVGSTIDKHRAFIKERFNVGCMTQIEFLLHMYDTEKGYKEELAAKHNVHSKEEFAKLLGHH